MVSQTRSLLTFHEPSRSIDTDNEATSDFWVQSAAVSSLFDAENTPEPCDDFMATWITRFIKVDHARPDIGFYIPLQGRTAGRNRSEVGRANEKLVIVFEEEGPLGSI